MNALIRLTPEGPLLVSAGSAAAPAAAQARTPVGGRGDARLATYVKKPAAPGDRPARDWAAEGLQPFAEWLAGARDLAPLLAPTDDPFALAPVHADLTLVAIEFPKFNDGRGLSIATLLRTRVGYRGELRAVGDVARDQLFQMARCGFDSFSLRADQDPQDALKAFADFGDAYQDSADGRGPVFRRRDEAIARAQAWLDARKGRPA